MARRLSKSVILGLLGGAPLLLLTACGGGGVNSASSNTSGGSAATTTPVVNYNDAEYLRSNGAVAAGALTAYQNGANGAGQTVAIIDSGIQTSSVEFSGRISTASADVAGNGSVVDTYGHGTAVAGVLAAARNGSDIEGVAWGSTVLAIRADTPGTCAQSGGCSFSDSNLAAGVDYARTNGAKIINMSLGGSAPSQTLVQAINRATAAGIIIVIAAGNSATANPDPFAEVASSSAARGLVIIAGSHNTDGTYSSFADKAGSYGQYFLTALGNNIASFDQNGTDHLYAGTSFASPLIAGAAALIEQAFPNLTPAQVVALLYSSATDAGATGVDTTYGNGILNIAKAFSPQGTTSVAGTTITVASTDQTVLSSAMGDAAMTTQGRAVVLDSLGRAFTFDLTANVARRTLTRPLVQAIGGDFRTMSQGLGPVTFSETIARGFADRPWAGLALGSMGFDQSVTARPVNGSATVQISKTMRAAFAFSEQGRTLANSLSPGAGGSFLVARLTDETPGFVTRTGMSFALLQQFGSTTLVSTVERGTVPAASLTDTVTPAYAIMGVRAERPFLGRLRLGLGVSSLREAATVLGARLAPAFGRSGATTRYVNLDARAALFGGWSLGAAWRNGWTQTDSGGVLDKSLIVSRSATVDLVHDGQSTRLALRVAFPPRVTSGGLTLTMPSSYDYATGAIGYSTGQVGLTPQGTERDVEASYGFHIGAGWMDTNVYWRHEPGNIALAPEDVGAALRYSLTF